MTVGYLGWSGWLGSGGTWDPSALDASVFAFCMGAYRSGGGGSDWSYVRWHGVDAEKVNFVTKTTTNSIFAAIWMMKDPYLGGVAALTYANSSALGQRGCIIAIGEGAKDIPPFSYPTRGIQSGQNPAAITPDYPEAGVCVGIVAHNGTSEAPIGLAELGVYTPVRCAAGYSESMVGAKGWTIGDLDRAALCLAVIEQGGVFRRGAVIL